MPFDVCTNTFSFFFKNWQYFFSFQYIFDSLAFHSFIQQRYFECVCASMLHCASTYISLFPSSTEYHPHIRIYLLVYLWNLSHNFWNYTFKYIYTHVKYWTQSRLHLILKCQKIFRILPILYNCNRTQKRKCCQTRNYFHWKSYHQNDQWEMFACNSHIHLSFHFPFLLHIALISIYLTTFRQIFFLSHALGIWFILTNSLFDGCKSIFIKILFVIRLTVPQTDKKSVCTLSFFVWAQLWKMPAQAQCVNRQIRKRRRTPQQDCEFAMDYCSMFIMQHHLQIDSVPICGASFVFQCP